MGNLEPTCDVLTNALLISQHIYSLFQQLAQTAVSILQNVTLLALCAAVNETWTNTLTMTTLMPLGKEIASVLENAEIRDQCIKQERENVSCHAVVHASGERAQEEKKVLRQDEFIEE